MRERRENRMKRTVKTAGAWALAAALALTAALAPAVPLQAAGNGSVQSSYRGGGHNMMILTDTQTVANVPKSLEETEVKWTTQVADDPSDWTNATTSPVEVDGTIYVLSNGRLKAFDAATGELIKAASDQNLINNYYNYYLMGGKVNGETMLFVQSQSIVAAYNSSLEQVWKTDSKDVAYGNDGYAPMYLSDGVIYGLTTSYSGSSAGAFAIDAANGVYLWQTEVPFTAVGQGSWAMGGGYSGMVAVGNYVICGSEGGTVYVFAKDSGAIVSQLDASADHMVNIRGAVAYADGNLWFTMTDGSIWRVAFSESDGSLGAASSAKITPTATNSTATPVIYNGRVYVGCTDTDASGSVQGAVAVLDASTLALIYEIPVAKQDNAWSNKCTDVAIAADTATGTVYGYAAYYDQPGSFVAFTDQPGQTAADSYDVRTLVPEGAANYSNGQILLGTEGNLYYTNDSGYMVCVGKKAEDVDKVEIISGAGSNITADGKHDAVFVSNAPYDTFLYVMVDGKILDQDCYTVQEGSTIVTLKADYLKGLSEGEHIIAIVSEGGVAEAQFQVVAAQTPGGANPGGDQNQGGSGNGQNPGGGDTGNGQKPGNGNAGNCQDPTGGQTVNTDAKGLPENAPKTGDLSDSLWMLLIVAGGISLGGVLLQRRKSR